MFNDIFSCFSTFSLQRHLPQTYLLLMGPYAMIQVPILLQPNRTVVANFVPCNLGLFRRNPWQPRAEHRLKNTVIYNSASHAEQSLNQLEYIILNTQSQTVTSHSKLTGGHVGNSRTLLMMLILLSFTFANCLATLQNVVRCLCV